MKTVKVHTSGHSQSVRLPEEFSFQSDEVFISKIGDAIVLTPVESLATAFDRGAAMLSDDFLADEVPDTVDSPQTEKFDYTEWQRGYFNDMPPGEFHRQALEYAETHPYTGKAERV